jgi:hypothetical protein
MPIPDMLINNASGNSIISFLDDNAGYNQIFMSEDASKTIFICLSFIDLFEWVVMTFGLKNVIATYTCAPRVDRPARQAGILAFAPGRELSGPAHGSSALPQRVPPSVLFTVIDVWIGSTGEDFISFSGNEYLAGSDSIQILNSKRSKASFTFLSYISLPVCFGSLLLKGKCLTLQKKTLLILDNYIKALRSNLRPSSSYGKPRRLESLVALISA